MKMLTYIFLLVLALPASAQVPNGGFETMEGWHVVDGPGNFKQNPNPYAGSYCGMIWTSNDKTVTLENHENYPYSGAAKPAGHPTEVGGSLYGQYQYQNSASGCGYATVTVLIFKYNDDDEIVTLQSGSKDLPPSLGWTEFMVNLDEFLPLTDDARVVVRFTTGTGCEVGSCCFLNLDGLRLGGGKPPHQFNGRTPSESGGRK